MSRESVFVVVFLAGFAIDLAQAATINVPWQLFNSPVPNINAKCGDTLAFQVSGFHSVTQVASKSCSASLVTQWAAAPAPQVVSIPLTTAGTTYYLCDVGSHCTAFFMLVEVNTTGPCGGASPSPAAKSPSPPAAKSPSPSPKASLPSPAAKSPSPSPLPSPAAKPAPALSPKAASPMPKRSPPKKKPAPCHSKPRPPCKKHAHGGK